MRGESENLDRYEAYLKGKLSGREREGFESRLKTDPDFRAEFDKFREEVNIIRALGFREEAVELMDEKVAKGKSKGLVFRSRWWLPLGVAAAIMLWLLWPAAVPKHSLVFDKYFMPYPNMIVGRDDTGDLYDALAEYDVGHFQSVIDALDKLPLSDTVRFYRAQSYLALGSTEEAISDLGGIDRGIFYELSVWYTGLAFLKAGQVDSAKVYFIKIGPDDLKYRDANEVLVSLGYEP